MKFEDYIIEKEGLQSYCENTIVRELIQMSEKKYFFKLYQDFLIEYPDKYLIREQKLNRIFGEPELSKEIFSETEFHKMNIK